MSATKNGNVPKFKEQNATKRSETKRDQIQKTDKKPADMKSFKMKEVKTKKQESISPMIMRSKTRAVL